MSYILKALDFTDDETMFAVDDFDVIEVEVVTGDEIIYIYKDLQRMFVIDGGAGTGRLADFFDGRYRVTKDELEKWNQRQTSYEWLRRKENDNT